MTLILHWPNGDKTIFGNIQFAIDCNAKKLWVQIGIRRHMLYIKDVSDPVGDVYHVYAVSNDWVD